MQFKNISFLSSTLEGWGGKEAQEGGTIYMADFTLLYGKNQNNIVKQLSSSGKKTKQTTLLSVNLDFPSDPL